MNDTVRGVKVSDLCNMLTQITDAKTLEILRRVIVYYYMNKPNASANT